MGEVRRALSHRDFRRLWVGQSASAVGDRLSVVAIAALVIDAGHGAGGLGLVLAGRSLALVLFIVAGGLIGDRTNRTRVMVGADSARIAALVGLALVPRGSPILAYAGLTFVVGAGEAFFQPAYRALLPSLLPDERLRAGLHTRAPRTASCATSRSIPPARSRSTAASRIWPTM